MFTIRRPQILHDIERHRWTLCNTTSFADNGYISFHTTIPTFCNWSQVCYFDCDNTDNVCLAKAKNQFDNETWLCLVILIDGQTIDCLNHPSTSEPDYFQDPAYAFGQSFIICGGSFLFLYFFMFYCFVRIRQVPEEARLLKK